MRHALVLLLAVPALGGCASLATQPPTPADDLRNADLLAAPPPPGERYYLLVFGSQSHPKVPRYTHSWATVVRVAAGGPGCGPAVEHHTISWMPATLDIRPWNFRVEPGANLDLHASVRVALGKDEWVAVWGPYEIWHGLYRRFLIQKGFVESGALGYQCVDSVGEAARTGRGCNCIHAITDMDPTYDRDLYPLRYFGVGASRHVVRQVLTRGAVIDPPETHDWLTRALGLDRYPLTRVGYRGPAVPFSPEVVTAAGRP